MPMVFLEDPKGKIAAWRCTVTALSVCLRDMFKYTYNFMHQHKATDIYVTLGPYMCDRQAAARR